MLKTRLLTQVFLNNGTRTLMLKRSASRKIAPGLWTGVGGHIEDGEQHNPEAAAIREIEEETGLSRADITRIELRYIMLRKVGDEIRQHYIYFAETRREEVHQSDEGDLSWIETAKLLSLELPLTTQKALEHYFATVHQPSDHVYVGVIFEEEVQWSQLEAES